MNIPLRLVPKEVTTCHAIRLLLPDPAPPPLAGLAARFRRVSLIYHAPDL